MAEIKSQAPLAQEIPKNNSQGQPQNAVNTAQNSNQTNQTQNQTANSAVPKKKKKFPFVACCFAAVVGVIFLVLGVGAYAYFTDTKIPVFSDAIKKVEETVGDGESQSAEVQKETVNNLVRGLAPVIAGDGNPAANLTQNTFSNGSFEGLMVGEQEVTSMKMDIKMDMTGNTEEFDKVTITAVGGFDVTDEENQMMEMTISLAVLGVEEFTGPVKAELRLIGKEFYFKIVDIPSIDPESDAMLKQIENQWIKIDEEDMEELGQTPVPFETPKIGSDEEVKELTDEQIKEFDEFVESLEDKIEEMPDRNVKGIDCSCSMFSWNQEDLKMIAEKYYEIYGEEMPSTDGLNDMDTLSAEVCVGKSTSYVHSMKIQMDANIEGEDVTIDLNMTMWDYGEEVTVSKPSGAKTIDELMQMMMGGDQPSGVYNEDMYPEKDPFQ